MFVNVQFSLFTIFLATICLLKTKFLAAFWLHLRFKSFVLCWSAIAFKRLVDWIELKCFCEVMKLLIDLLLTSAWMENDKHTNRQTKQETNFQIIKDEYEWVVNWLITSLNIDEKQTTTVNRNERPSLNCQTNNNNNNSNNYYLLLSLVVQWEPKQQQKLTGFLFRCLFLD